MSWKEGIDEAAVDKAVQAGEILPKLPLPEIREGKASSDETLLVRFTKNPERVESPNLQKGFAYFAEVEHQGAKKSMIVPDSLRFNLAKECKLQSIEEPSGHRFVIGASIQDMKAKDNRPAMKGVKLYWCQYKPDSDSAATSASETKKQESGDASAPPAAKAAEGEAA